MLMRRFRWTMRWLSMAFAALLVACLSYDHRWVQQQQEKQRARERLKPATLEHRGGGKLVQRRSMQVRAYATPAYAAETLNWEARFDELLREATSILAPNLGL